MHRGCAEEPRLKGTAPALISRRSWKIAPVTERLLAANRTAELPMKVSGRPRGWGSLLGANTWRSHPTRCDSSVLTVYITRRDIVAEYPMNSSTPGSPDAGPADLTGLRILIVEDSWQIAMALKSLLGALGAEVAGPVATAADAERLISEKTPDAAIVDFSLRGGEMAAALIDRLNDRGVRVVVMSGYTVLPLAPEKAVAVLQKPIVEAQLLAALRPVMTRAPGR
jgi:CheY-like chemotaxis protein